MVIGCCGSHVKVVLNGQKVVDTDTGYYPSKVAAHPGLERECGYIGLQNHGSGIEFRKIRIKRLPEDDCRP
jgi:hypothetical protein